MQSRRSGRSSRFDNEDRQRHIAAIGKSRAAADVLGLHLQRQERGILRCGNVAGQRHVARTDHQADVDKSAIFIRIPVARGVGIWMLTE